MPFCRRHRHGQDWASRHPEGHEPLTGLRAGQKAEISAVAAGCKARSRLASLGLIPGTALTMVANAGIGPVLLSVGESRLALERGIAEKVGVRHAA